MTLWIPGTADPQHVLAGQRFSSKGIYYGLGEMPLKNASNGDGAGSNHHLAKQTSAGPGVIYLRPINPTDPITAFQGDVWIRKDDPNFNPVYWRSDVAIFGLQGGMPNRSAENIHMPAAAVTVWSGDRVFLQPPIGYYDGSTWVTGAAPGLVASNIRNGVNILGLTGTLVEGRRTASGTFVDNGLPRTINGLGFTPSSIELAFSNGGDHTRVGYSYGQWYACITNANQTAPMSTTFHQSSVFAGGFTCEVPFASGWTITWRATE